VVQMSLRMDCKTGLITWRLLGTLSLFVTLHSQQWVYLGKDGDYQLLLARAVFTSPTKLAQ
jgi:hypothetical protein